MRVLSLLGVLLVLAGCTTGGDLDPTTPSAPTGPAETTKIVTETAEGTAEIQAGKVSAAAAWPDFDVPKAFLGGNITVTWTATQSVGEMAVHFFRTNSMTDISSQTLPKSPTTIKLEENDPRVLGAEKVRVAPASAGATAQIEFKVEGNFLIPAEN